MDLFGEQEGEVVLCDDVDADSALWEQEEEEREARRRWEEEERRRQEEEEATLREEQRRLKSEAGAKPTFLTFEGPNVEILRYGRALSGWHSRPTPLKDVHPLQKICLEVVCDNLSHPLYRQRFSFLPLDIKEKVIALQLRSCRLTDEDFKTCAPEGIESVDLSDGCQLTGKSIETLAHNCPGLTSLNLTNCWDLPQESIVLIVRRFSHLKRLVLDRLEIYPHTIKRVFNLAPHLASLSLKACDWKDLQKDKGFYFTESDLESGIPLVEAFKAIKNCTSLTDLTLTNESFTMPPDLVAEVVKDCPSLTSLSVGGMPSSDFMVYAEMERLVHLDISIPTRPSRDHFSSTAVEAFVNHHSSSLLSLSLASCRFISEKNLMTLSGLTELSELDLSDLSTVFDQVLRIIGKGCRNLRSLRLAKCCNVTCQAFYSKKKKDKRAPVSRRPTKWQNDAERVRHFARPIGEAQEMYFPQLQHLDLCGAAMATADTVILVEGGGQVSFGLDLVVSFFTAPPRRRNCIGHAIQFLPSLQTLKVCWNPSSLQELYTILPALSSVKVVNVG